MERALMRLEVLKGETLGQLNNNFREKVQLEEQLEENEVQIHFKRGMMHAFELVQKEIGQIVQGEKLEEAKIERLQRTQQRARDNHEDKAEVKNAI